MKAIASICALFLLSAWATAGRPARVHEIAQVGDGGGIRTVFWVTNLNTEAVALRVDLFRGEGVPFELTMEGTTAASFEFELAAGETRKLVTAGTSAQPSAGWARLEASRDVGVQAVFEIRSGGNLVTQAAVEPPGPLGFAELFVDLEGDTNTGVAVANISRGVIRVRLTLYGESGAQVGDPVDLNLVPNGHTAQFVSQLFPSAGIVRGRLSVDASGSISLVTLQQTGLVLGTLPVIVPIY